MKKLNKKGFTLAELLIVVAIIAILIAIGIPVFSTAMERSRETVDLANIRAAYAEFQSGQLTGSRIIRGVYKMDFKQTDGSGWLIDTSGLKNLLSPNSGSAGVTSGNNAAKYDLDTPKTAGDTTNNAVKFEVSGNGKPIMSYVGYTTPTTALAGTNEEYALSDAPLQANGTYETPTKDNSSYYLAKAK